MYFASFTYKDKENYGILSNDKKKVIPIENILNKTNNEVPDNLLDFIRTYSDTLIPELNLMIDDDGISIEDIKINAPIPYPRRNIFCLGKNYAEHAVEIKSLPGNTAGIPEYPIYFTKIADPAIGYGDKIMVPEDITTHLDYEVELAIIIGKDGINISPEDAEEYIFGYTIGNDITARDIQKKHIQWFKGKSLDSTTSLGPYIVHKSEIEFPPHLNISCRVNGELRQNSNTSKLIFDIPYIISDLSKGMTLRAGDIILTGTPAGVGMGFEPPKFLKPGDIVECYIEKIGKLINTVG